MCDANPKRHGGSGTPTITITPPINESPEANSKGEQIRILTSPDKGPINAGNGSVNTLDNMVVGTSLRPLKVHAAKK